MSSMAEETTQEKRKDFTGVKTKDLNKRQQRARKAARAGKYTDRNLDGIPDRDQIDWNKLEAEWQWVRGLISEIPEIEILFEQAVDSGAFETETGINGFINNVIDSQWWKDNNQFARDAFAQRTTDPAAYAARVQDARNFVQQQARAIGAPIDEATLARLAERVVVDGWDQQGREYLLRNELGQKVGVDAQGRMFGAAGTTIDRLRRTAMSNGLQYDDAYFQSAAQSVALGLTDNEFWERQIREEAAGYWPAYSEQIRGGLDAMSLASNYVNLMARTLEIDPNSISLNDPNIRKATTMLDESGKPRPMSLWEFQEDLRNDPRWMNTDQAVKSISDIGTGILERFGIL
jgi:hypothetical protein